MEMRRKNRQVTENNEIESIIKECDVCRIGFNDNGNVYIVPMNFGYIYENGALTLYLHSSKVGRKMEILKEQSTVGIEMDARHELVSGESACGYSYYFASLIGTGSVCAVEEEQEKRKGLELLMKNLTGKEGFEYDEKWLKAVAVIKISVEEFTCKKHAK